MSEPVLLREILDEVFGGGNRYMSDDDRKTYPVAGTAYVVTRDGDRVSAPQLRSMPVVTAHRLGLALVDAAADAASEVVASYREAFPGLDEVIGLHGRDRYESGGAVSGSYGIPQAYGCCAQSPGRDTEARLCDEIAKHNDAIQALRDRYPDGEDGGPAKTVRPIWVENAITNLRRARNEAEHDLRAATGG